MGIPQTQNLGKYLGVPVLHGKVTKDTYHNIIEGIDQKLSRWKVKALSLASRVTQVSSVLLAIPACAMQTSVLPATTYNEIDQRI
ncbi:Putative ribonuclease H protein At1g65750 [Linum perenne]